MDVQLAIPVHFTKSPEAILVTWRPIIFIQEAVSISIRAGRKALNDF